MTFGRVDSVPPRVLVELHYLLSATQVTELHPAGIPHCLLRALHRLLSQSGPAKRLVDKDTARPGHRDIVAPDLDDADLETHVGDESRTVTDQRVDIGRGISVGSLGAPGAEVDKILTVKKFPLGGDIVAAEVSVLDDFDVPAHGSIL